MLKRRELPAITKVTFCCEPALVEQKDFPQLRVVHFKSYAEGILSGFDKSVGMKKIMELEGLKREDLWAFGDSENDRDMLLFAGNAVCMPGAPADFDHFVRYRCKILFCRAGTAGIKLSPDSYARNERKSHRRMFWPGQRLF